MAANLQQKRFKVVGAEEGLRALGLRVLGFGRALSCALKGFQAWGVREGGGGVGRERPRPRQSWSQ